MSRTRFLILATMAFFLVAYVSLFESGNGLEHSENRHEKKFFDLDAKKVAEIEICYKAGHAVHLKKENSQWRLKEPCEKSVSPQEVEEILSVFEYGWIERLESRPGELQDYGLNQPEIVLTVTMKNAPAGSKRSLSLGSNNPTNTACYAMIGGDPCIYLVGILYKSELEEVRSLF